MTTPAERLPAYMRTSVLAFIQAADHRSTVMMHFLRGTEQSVFERPSEALHNAIVAYDNLRTILVTLGFEIGAVGLSDEISLGGVLKKLDADHEDYKAFQEAMKQTLTSLDEFDRWVQPLAEEARRFYQSREQA